MRPIREKLRSNGNTSAFHVREDIKVLMEYCNMLADYINQLNDELEETKRELAKKNAN